MVDYDVLRAEDFDIARLLHSRIHQQPTSPLVTQHGLLASLGNPTFVCRPSSTSLGPTGRAQRLPSCGRSLSRRYARSRAYVATSGAVRGAHQARGRLDHRRAFRRVGCSVERANAGLPISFAELTTALALLAFSEVRADLLYRRGWTGRSLGLHERFRPSSAQRDHSNRLRSRRCIRPRAIQHRVGESWHNKTRTSVRRCQTET